METPLRVLNASLFGEGYINVPAYKPDAGFYVHDIYFHLGGLFAPLDYTKDWYTPSYVGGIGGRTILGLRRAGLFQLCWLCSFQSLITVQNDGTFFEVRDGEASFWGTP